MIKLLIVDDERIIRETIASLVDWESLGITLIGTAENGIEAYNIILDEYPEIVLTDIKMPGLGGLDLIQRIHEINPDTQFVILSGYGEFEFARRAMKYGVKHYLLKPCNEEQIIESLRHAKEDYFHTVSKKKFSLENNASISHKEYHFSFTHMSISQKVIACVEENLEKTELSLKWIAENYLFMNVDYLSKRFAKETGMKFSKYLTNLRIQRAKHYMETGAYSVLEIAERVGCGQNPQYFSQIFKKNTGQSPSQYLHSIQDALSTEK